MSKSAAAIFFLCLAFGCRAEESRRLEGEAQSLAHKIDALRNAPNASKAALLSVLEQASCEDRAVCQLKEGCVAAYVSHQGALEASARARELLADRDGGVAATIAAATELNRAEQQLEQARALTERCASRQGELLRAVKKR